MIRLSAPARTSSVAKLPCKHVYAVHVAIQREELPDGTLVETTSVTTTHRREWSAYNEAQEREGEHFPVMLNELCELIEQPPQPTTGRPRLPLADVVQAIAHKVYTGDSGRRAMSTIRSAQSDGHMVKSPSFSSLHRYMENPEVTPVLRDLIRASALPVAPIETTFAVDSSGFASSVYDRWFDHKWKPRDQRCQVGEGAYHVRNPDKRGNGRGRHGNSICGLSLLEALCGGHGGELRGCGGLRGQGVPKPRQPPCGSVAFLAG